MSKTTPDDLEEIAKAIAFALSDWAFVESALLALFHQISGITPYEKAHAAFSAIVSFDARLDVVDALIPLSGETEINVRIWQKLSEKIGKFYKRRHRLAHFAFVTSTTGIALGTIVKTDMVPLWPSDYNAAPLRLPEIQERGRKFRELAESIQWFWFLAVTRGLALESPPQPPFLVRKIQNAIVQNQVEPASRPQSSLP